MGQLITGNGYFSGNCLQNNGCSSGKGVASAFRSPPTGAIFPHDNFAARRFRLTIRPAPLGAAPGHAVPTPRELSARRVRHDYDYSGAQACASVLFFRSLRQAAGLFPRQAGNRIAGRSHRAKIGKTRLQYCIDLMREVLGLPDTHRIGIVPGSDTGAFEMAMWTMLGARGVTTLAWESFGEGWVTDAVKQLKLEPTVMRADYGQLPDLDKVDWSDDVLFTWNGTTSGVRVPDGEWIAADRQGLTFADATSAVFAYDLPWDKIDVATFSWQKVLGGEGAHGVLILGPRAVERLESYTPEWPLPKVFRLISKGKLAEGVFKGETINTPRCWPSKTRSSRWNGPRGRRPRRAQGALHRQCRGARQDRRRTRVAVAPCGRSRHPLEDLGLPLGRRRGRGLHQGVRRPARKGRRGL
jgi:hypothetical protein